MRSPARSKALLRGAPGVTLLATSQEPLQHAGRAAVSRRAARRTKRNGCARRTRVRGRRAVRGARARARSALRAERRERAAAIDICRRLDGLPLAIELAAARVPRWACAGCATSSTRASSCSPAVRAPRCAATRRCAPRSTGATGCSTKTERAVFRRLGVFAGGFTSSWRRRWRRRAARRMGGARPPERAGRQIAGGRRTPASRRDTGCSNRPVRLRWSNWRREKLPTHCDGTRRRCWSSCSASMEPISTANCGPINIRASGSGTGQPARGPCVVASEEGDRRSRSRSLHTQVR